MKTVAICPQEGCHWEAPSVPEDRATHVKSVHGILFDNRQIWDTINGFRADLMEQDQYDHTVDVVNDPRKSFR